jgi:hypothetical protein
MAYDPESTSADELKSAAQQRGVDASGTKVEIAARLNEVEAVAVAPVADPASVDAAAKAHAEDEKFRRENPNEPRVVGPREGVGGY